MADTKKASRPTIPTVKLASGHSMPIIALGTWKSPPGKTATAVKAAVENGYLSLDCANDYNNEDEIGECLEELFKSGAVKREDLHIQIKLWNTNHRPEHVMPDLEASLKDLRLDYVDSYVIHWPQAGPSYGAKAAVRTDGAHPGNYKTNPMFPVDDDGYFCSDPESHYIETWHVLEDLVEKGLVRTIGLSNFNKRQIGEVLKAVKKHPVSVLQNECHPYLQQKDLIDFCKFNNIVFQAYSPLGSGDTHLATTSSPTGVIPLKDPFIADLAAKYNKSPAQVMLRWNVQRGVAVVAKSVTPSRIADNIDIFDFELSAEEMEAFSSINCGWRHLLWRETSNHPDYPFKDELPHDYKLEKAPEQSSSGTEK